MRRLLPLLLALPALAEPVTLSAGSLRVTLDSAAGYAVTGLVQQPAGTVLLGDVPATVSRSPWQIFFRDGAGRIGSVAAADAKSATHQLADGTLTVTWRQVGSTAWPADLTVTATIRARADGDTVWQIAVAGTAEHPLWQVDFPRIVGLRGLGDDQLALPQYLGRLIRQPASRSFRRSLIYPQPGSMQWLAWWGSPTTTEPAPAELDGRSVETGWSPDRSAATGLYWATEDGRAYYKRFGLQCGVAPDRFAWWIEQVPELRAWPVPAGRQTIDYRQPYDVVVAGLTGDYHDAAAKYLRWASQQAWSRRGPAETWPAVSPEDEDGAVRFVPPWFRDTAFWAKYYQEPAKVVPEWAAYQQWLGVPIASHYYRYNVAEFDDNYPEHLPSDPYLRQGVRDGRDMGVRALPYVNGSIWDLDTQSWIKENGAACAAKNNAGALYLWDIRGELFGYGCPATRQWQTKMVEWGRKMIGEQGFSGIYLDVLAAMSAMLCYDPSHGHPVHGGSYWGQGNRRLLYDLRRAVRAEVPDAAFFSEEIGELYNDLLDGHLALDQMRSNVVSGEQVFPLFPLVYHAYTIHFGSDAVISQAPDVFCWSMAQQLVWGSQLLNSAQVVPPPRPGDPNSEFLREVVRAYHVAGRPFLQGGTWERLAVRPTGTPAGPGALALTSAPHQVTYQASARPGQPSRWHGPAVMASAWRRGEAVGVVLVNQTATDQPVELTVRAAALKLPGAKLWQAWPEVADLGAVDGRHAFTVPARKVRILVVAAAAPATTPLLATPWSLVSVTDGPLPAAEGPVGALFAASDGPVRTAPAGAGVSATALWLTETGALEPRRGHQAERRAAAAEGHGLPRQADQQPFLLYRRLPHTATGGEVLVLSGDATHLSARVAGGVTLRFAEPGYTVLRDVATGKLLRGLADGPDTTVTTPAGGPCLVGYAALTALRPHLGLPGGVLEVANLVGPLRELTSGAATQRERALAAATNALADLVRKLGPQVGVLRPRGPLEALHEALNALVSAQVGWRLVARADHDWLAPGVPQEVRLLAWRPGPATAPRQIALTPLGEWPKETLPTGAPAPDRTDLFTAFPVRHRFQVEGLWERLAPVYASAAVPLGGATGQLTDLLLLEAARPVEIMAPRGATNAVAGRNATARVVLRNLSPTDVTLRLTATGPTGWQVACEPAEVPAPALSDAAVTVRVTPPPGAPSGPAQVLVTANHSPTAANAVVALLDLAVSRPLQPWLAGATTWPAPPATNLARHRPTGTVAIWVGPGERLQANLRNVRVTIYSTTLEYRLLDPDLVEVKAGQVPVDAAEDLDLAVTKPGTWLLKLVPGQGSCEVRVANRLVAEVATAQDPLALFTSPITRCFVVPAGATQFRLGFRDGGPDETARFQITSPTGRVALDYNGNGSGAELPVEVRPNEAGQLWTMRIEPRQDMQCWLAGEVNPYLSTAPERALVDRR